MIMIALLIQKKEIEYLAIKACALMIELSIRNMVFPSALL